LYDKITSKIIYALTSCKIQQVAELCRKLGAESAGTGVCFLSKKMWLNLLLKNNYKINNLTENKKPLKLKIYKKIFLCIKKITLNNIIISEKENM
jgi:hypothetical protein